MEVAEVVVDMVVGFNDSKALTITNIDIGGGGGYGGGDRQQGGYGKSFSSLLIP